MSGFGWALDVLHDGVPVRRSSWNHETFSGKDFLILVPGSEVKVEAGRPLGMAMPNLVGEELIYGNHIDLVHVGGVISVAPWQPIQADLLAEDWVLAT